MQIPRLLAPDDDETPFPPVELALRDPDGLLAVGGSLSIDRLMLAYREGIFPWYNEGQPVLWWSPDPRSVLFPEKLKISRSLAKKLRRTGHYRVSMDRDFDNVIRSCAAPRSYADGTWILPEMMAAYQALHRRGVAHSVECYMDNRLAGGLYGIALGRIFFGESMFSLESDASKISFVYLVRQLQHWGFGMIDCQIHSPFLDQLGAELIPRAEFMAHLKASRDLPGPPVPWTLEISPDTVL